MEHEGMIMCDPYSHDLLPCPFCAVPASIGVMGTDVDDAWWVVLCQHDLFCPLLDIEVSSIELQTLDSKWNRRLL